jgi:tight adherence protein B
MSRKVARSLLALGLVLLTAGLAGTAWSQQEQGVLIRNVDSQSFPKMTVTVSLANPTAISPGDVQVTEDGKPVKDITLTSLTTSSQGIDVVLVIDTSGSMVGAPLASAVAAAKEFIAASPSQVRIGLVTFSDAARVRRQLSTNRTGVRSTLRSLQATGETALYDAVATAAKLFSGEAQHNIVLLTDGGDTVSHASLSAAANEAQGADATIFAIGLSTPETDVKALKTLARKTNGRYSSAATADLTSIYQNLAKEISSQYLIAYRSVSAGGANVSIRVTIAGSTDTSLVLTPRTPIPPPSPQVVAPSKQVALKGDVGLAIALGLSFLAAFAVMLLLVGPAARARRDRELAQRITSEGGGNFDSAASRVDPAHVVAALAPTLVQAGNRLAEAGGFQASLEVKLERADAPVTPGEFVAASVVGALVGAAAGGVLIGGLLFAVIFGFVGAVLPSVILSIATQRRMKRLHAQLPDILMVLASSIRAGHSFMQALDTVSKEIGDPGAKEFARALAEIRLGRSVEEAMNAMAERIDSDDFRWAILAVNIQREVGGNLAEILDTVAETVRDRDTIRRQIGTLSAEGKLSMYILIALPVFIALYLYKINREYIQLLFSSGAGRVMVIGGVLALIAGVFWMRKIVKIDV